jgi:hypothetical protein
MEKTYFQKIMAELAIAPNDEFNFIELYNPEADFPQRDTELLQIFSEHPEGYEILPYSIDGEVFNYTKFGQGKTASLNAKNKLYSIIRLEKPIIKPDGKEQRFKFPTGLKGQTHPFFPKNVINAYKEAKEINTLIITEGYKKAFKAGYHGAYVVGLSSITHYKDGSTGTLHPDILKLIDKCKPKNIVLLYDGDCTKISDNALAEGKDLYTRPGGFFNSAKAIRELLKDSQKRKGFDIYFCHVLSDDLPGFPKGLDDLLCSIAPERIPEVIQDLETFSAPSKYFHKININDNINKVAKYLCIDKIKNFYEKFSSQIQEREFIYYGTKYKFNSEEGELKIVQPKEAKLYFRVGDNYFKRIEVMNKYKMIEKQIVPRKKSTIADDHGKNIFSHIDKYENFVNIPDHTNWQETYHNCFNTYHPFEWEPEEGSIDNTMFFLNHIFGEQINQGLDYLTLLYKKPTQILPILCLVSRENNTGKSTFAKWLKHIFTQNMAIVGNAEISSEFNTSWASKLIICCEESFIEKKATVEKIKALSTADKINLRAMHSNACEIDFFGKFILLSNNEENFIYASEDDIRYWVRKIKKPTQDQPNLLDNLIDEIPAFLYFLNNRTMYFPEKRSRMWFKFEDIKTEALGKLIAANMPTVEKEIRKKITELFYDTQQEHLEFTVRVIAQIFFKNRYEENYIEKILKERFNLKSSQKDGKRLTKRYQYPVYTEVIEEGTNVRKIAWFKDIGRPYCFNRKDFISDEEWAEHILEHEEELNFLNKF